MIALPYTRRTSRMQNLRRDVLALRGHVEDLLSRRQKTTLRHKILTNSHRLENLAEETVKDTSAYLQSQRQRAVKASRKGVSRRPLTSLVSAFVVGMALSKLVLRR